MIRFEATGLDILKSLGFGKGERRYDEVLASVHPQELEEQLFQCQRCGKCCHRQFVTVSATEINQILRLLDQKTDDEIEGNICDCMTFTGRLPEWGPALIQVYRNTFFNFWQPKLLDYYREATIVLLRVVHAYPTSGRCVFFNPMDVSCFIYPARPIVCRLYPFFLSMSSDEIKIEKSCPGLGQGKPINLQTLKAKSELAIRLLLKDKELVNKFVEEREFTPLRRRTKPGREPSDQEVRELTQMMTECYFGGAPPPTNHWPKGTSDRLLDPLEELGVIPRSLMTEMLAKGWKLFFRGEGRRPH